MRLLKVAEHLQGKGAEGEFEIGKNVFVNTFPADVTEGILVRDGYNGAKVNAHIHALRIAPIQFVARGPDTLAVHDMAVRAADLITTDARTEIDNMLVHSIRQTTEPIPFPFSPAGLVEMIVNLTMSYAIVRK